MHIGFITSHFPFSDAKSVGGIGTSIKNLSVELINSGQEVSVFVYDQLIDEVTIENGITIYKIKKETFKGFTWFVNRKKIQQKIEKVSETSKIDLIEAPDWTGISAFMKFKCPLVIRFHGSDAYFCKLEKRKQKFKNFYLEKCAIHSADAYIAPTDFAGKLTAEIFDIKKEITTIHNGVSLSKFNNNSPEKFEKNSVLYVGAIIRKKGVLELPAIFSNLLNMIPDCTLTLIGSDSVDVKTDAPSTWQLLKNSLDENSLKRVKYLGNIAYSEIQSYIKNAHVCIFPSYAETLGMVTIESMALGKAIVNSNIGWSSELIDDNINGFLVHPSDHNMFAEKIANLLLDEKLRSKFSTNAVKKVMQQFDIKNLVNQNIEFYSNLVQKK